MAGTLACVKIDQNRELFFRFQVFRQDDEQLQGVGLIVAVTRLISTQLFALSMFDENYEYPVEFLVSNASVYILRQGTAESVTNYWVQHVVSLKNIKVLHFTSLATGMTLCSSSAGCCACRALSSTPRPTRQPACSPSHSSPAMGYMHALSVARLNAPGCHDGLPADDQDGACDQVRRRGCHSRHRQ